MKIWRYTVIKSFGFLKLLKIYIENVKCTILIIFSLLTVSNEEFYYFYSKRAFLNYSIITKRIVKKKKEKRKTVLWTGTRVRARGQEGHSIAPPDSFFLRTCSVFCFSLPLRWSLCSEHFPSRENQ